jgi:hypothetical protein
LRLAENFILITQFLLFPFFTGPQFFMSQPEHLASLLCRERRSLNFHLCTLV